MSFHHINEISGTEYPAGRKTRVIVGPNGPVEAEHFVMGHVTIYPGGKVPLHDHEMEEVYFIAAGNGLMHLCGESKTIQAGSYIFIRSGEPHSLENTSADNMVMIFVYAPKGVAAHWKQELEGKIK